MHAELKILLLSSYSNCYYLLIDVVPNLFNFISSVNHKRRCFTKCSWCYFQYNIKVYSNQGLSSLKNNIKYHKRCPYYSIFQLCQQWFIKNPPLCCCYQISFALLHIQTSCATINYKTCQWTPVVLTPNSCATMSYRIHQQRLTGNTCLHTFLRNS